MDLSECNVNHETGCMLKAPLHSLPPYFEVWNQLASAVPTLTEKKCLREEVDKMPLLDHTKLDGHHQLRLAHLQLSYLTSGYVWQDGDEGVAKVLPRCLAIPFYKISEQLGVQPILSHIDLVLANWDLVDPNGPYELENLKCLYHIPGDKASDWFCIVTFMVEFSFTKCLKHVFRVVELLASPQFLSKGDYSYSAATETKIARCLDEIAGVLQTMQASLARMHDHLTGKEFFNVIRPYLGGWGGEGNALPDGLIYEGISDKPIKMTGGSAAQSPSLQVVDALLEVKHTEDKREFLVHMRSFMLPEHKHLIEDIEQQATSIVDLVTSSTNETLKSSYNQCLCSLIELRNYHIQIVKKYIIIPSRQANEGKYGSLDNKGTGGTSLIPFLSELLFDTEKKLVFFHRKDPSSDQTKNGHDTSMVKKLLLTGAALLTVVYFAQRVIHK